MTIHDFFIEYSSKIDRLDLELLIAHTLKKPREFVLAHPEFKIPSLKIENLKFKIARRAKGEPLAYITGKKEFFGLDFKVDKNTLIPRPETELLVELALKEIQDTRYKIQDTKIIDIGTGSGNIIISIASQLMKKESRIKNYGLFGIDISPRALAVAKHNAGKHAAGKKIKFIHGNLLNPIIENSSAAADKIQNSKMIILANLPYLSEKIYSSAATDVRKYEPRSALFSENHGLAHYEKLLEQIKILTKNCKLQTANFFEISPEQKTPLNKLIKKYFPKAKIEFFKDLAGKWRVCKLEI